MTRPLALIIAVSSAMIPGLARAEADEISVGIEGALVLPRVRANDSTAIAAATWGVGAYAQYGLLEDLYLQGRFMFSAFEGTIETTKEYRGRMLEGVLGFSSTMYHFEVGARYKVYAGYDLAPYVEAHAGWMWSAYRGQTFRDAVGRDYGLVLADFGEGQGTVAGGVAVDYRVMNSVLVGGTMRYVHAFGRSIELEYLAMAVQASWYW
jgi:hypothetical protein